MSRFTQPGGSGGSAELPQGLGTNNSPSFDKVYVTNNGNGTNIKVGDDLWIGDIDNANMISMQGVQNSSQGGIIFGSNLSESIQSTGEGSLDLHANANINLFVDAAPGWINLSAYEGAYVNGISPDTKIATMADLPSVMAYGAFHDENSFGPYAANSEHALSYETTDMSSDVHIGGINNSEIIVDKAGKFNIQFSTQFHSTTGAGIVYVWLKKNGTSMPWTNTRFDITANNPYAVAAWNWFVDAAQYDAFEIFWSATSTTMKVEAITGLTGTKPNVPSNIVTVTQVG